MYKEAKTKFVKEKLKGMKWKDREYIEALLNIEKLAQGERFGLVTGYMINGYQEHLAKEWKAIHMELDSKAFLRQIQREKAEKRKETRDQKKFLADEKRELIAKRQDWVKMGGVL